MKYSFGHIIFKDEILQSESFGEQYREYFSADITPAINTPMFDDIGSMLNQILAKHELLTEFQREILNNIFNAFNNIRAKIDPKRLKTFESCINEDDDLLLFRNTETGLTNLIIHSEDSFAFSFISKIDNQRTLNFYDLQADFELISYKFFSN